MSRWTRVCRLCTTRLRERVCAWPSRDTSSFPTTMILWQVSDNRTVVVCSPLPRLPLYTFNTFSNLALMTNHRNNAHLSLAPSLYSQLVQDCSISMPCKAAANRNDLPRKHLRQQRLLCHRPFSVSMHCNPMERYCLDLLHRHQFRHMRRFHLVSLGLRRPSRRRPCPRRHCLGLLRNRMTTCHRKISTNIDQDSSVGETERTDTDQDKNPTGTIATSNTVTESTNTSGCGLQT
jgi:hypothetical protein